MMGLPWGSEGLRRGFWRDLPSSCAQPRWPPRQAPTFRAGTEIVSLGVTVSDKRANFLTDLTRDDLEIFEDGKKQTIEYFARGDEDSGPELHIGLLFDTSGSMDADIKLSRSAAVKFLNTLSDAKDITLVDFDTEVRVAKYGQLDFPRLVERIRSRKPSGFTAMYDALGVYLDSAAEAQGRKILVLFTDGGDTRSTIRFGDVLTLVRASDVTVYAVGFLENQPSSVRAEQRLRLTQLSTESGGEAFFPYAMKQIEEAYDKILMQIRAQYSVGYVSTNTATDGSWRKVEIKVRRPDSRDLRVQSRKGYFAPYRKLDWALPGPSSPKPIQSSCGHAVCLRSIQTGQRVRDPRRPGPRGAGAGRRTEPRRRPSGAPRRHRIRQDLHDGAGARAREPAHAGHGAQQDAGRAALSGVQALLSRERRRVLRQLLRLLPAGSLRAVDRLVHREGSDDQRRDRSHAAVRHALALRAARRHHRRQRVVHLRSGIAGGVLRAAAGARSGSADRSRADPRASWWRSSTSATTWSSAAAPSASAATSSKWCRRTKSTRCASACSATRWTSWRGSTR